MLERCVNCCWSTEMGAINSAGKRCGGDSVTRLTFELRVLKNEEKVTSSSGVEKSIQEEEMAWNNACGRSGIQKGGSSRREEKKITMLGRVIENEQRQNLDLFSHLKGDEVQIVLSKVPEYLFGWMFGWGHQRMDIWMLGRWMDRVGKWMVDRIDR